jgi:protein involved in ribonucleotide reduction
VVEVVDMVADTTADRSAQEELVGTVVAANTTIVAAVNTFEAQMEFPLVYTFQLEGTGCYFDFEHLACC